MARRKKPVSPTYFFRAKTAGGLPAVIAVYLGPDDPARVVIFNRSYRLSSLRYETSFDSVWWPPVNFTVTIETAERGEMVFSGRVPLIEQRPYVRDESGHALELLSL